jgi:small-conductance mechanosensitive channel
MNRIQEFLNQVILKIGDDYELRIINVALIILIFIAVWLLRWAVAQAMKSIYANFKISKENKQTVRRFFNIVISGFAFIMILKTLGIDLDALLGQEIIKIGEKGDPNYREFSVSNIVNVILIYFIVQVIMWIINQILSSYFQRDKVDVGAQYAINQVIRYVVFTVAILAAIQALGFDLTLIWGGAAALLVGFGLGLQQTFNDLVSGLLLLVERTVEVGDTLDIDGMVGTVERIGIRVSHVRSRDDITVLVPNSKLVTSKVINWTSQREATRFQVAVGVAYGSDTALVKKLLLEVANHHEQVEPYPSPYVIFKDFGASSLDFEVHFWSKELMAIEKVKSDLRFDIDARFRKHNIEIPFPQHDVWFKNQK